MKKMKSFNIYFLSALLISLLLIQPAVILSYTKGQESQFWELASNSALFEGEFTDEPQEIVFVYRKKTIIIPFQIAAIPFIPAITPSGRSQTTQYGELLRTVSGIFLFGSTKL